MSTQSEREAAEAERVRNLKTLTKEEYTRLTAEQRALWVLDSKTGEYVRKPA